jgi:putative tryptophan/tyrosine transport system substrate-binding protein
MIQRREFITLLGGAAAWPLAVRAQQGQRMRRIGVLMAFSESNPQFRSLIDTFMQGLTRSGWVDGRNVQIDVRWADGDVGRMRAFAKELTELQPDVILAGATPVTDALQKETHTIPIVFVIVSDPVGAGFVAGLSHPGGNITGFINVEATMGGKWLELLKEIAPRVERTAIMFNPDTAPSGGTYFLGPFETAARSLAVEPITARVRSDAEIEATLASRTSCCPWRSASVMERTRDRPDPFPPCARYRQAPHARTTRSSDEPADSSMCCMLDSVMRTCSAIGPWLRSPGCGSTGTIPDKKR